MSIFSKFRGQKAKHDVSGKAHAFPQEYLLLLDFNQKLNALLKQDKYLARSGYRNLIPEFSDIRTFFTNLKKSLMLPTYCETNGIQESSVEAFLHLYSDIEDHYEDSTVISEHNDSFLKSHLKSDKDYLDNILKTVDKSILLDEEQRKVVLTDEDHILVVAGAGAGKTTTVAAKVKYLVDKKHVKPEQILVISFTNKAVGELKSKINKALRIPCSVTTFHRTGYAILRQKDADKKNVVDSGYMNAVINDYLKNEVLREPEMIDKLILFFGSYFNAPYEGDDLNAFFNYISKEDFTSMRSNMNEYVETIVNKRTGKSITINYESLRSAEEVAIANYLYLHKIEYEYEKQYPYSFQKSHRAYTPDFTITQDGRTIYLEHFGITEAGTHSRYTPEQLEIYKKEVNDKILFHRSHGTELIYTFSQYNDGRSTLDHLSDELKAKGIRLDKRPSEEVYRKIVTTEENKYISKLVRLICAFITNFKTNGFNTDKFRDFNRSTDNVRTKLFLDVCHQCYLEYSKKLKQKGAVDFEDMINESAKILKEQKDLGCKVDFKYIIIDEYQDISRQRFNLAQALSNICDAKIIAVGDDWQSIYAYAGSDISLFTHFSEALSYGKELKITRTYRNSQEVIDIAGNFIQKNSSQIKKSLISPKRIDKPIIIESYSEEAEESQVNKGGKYFFLGQAVEKVIGQFLSTNEVEGKPTSSSILLIGRYGFDAFNLCRSDLFIYDENSGNVKSKKYPQAKIDFLTAHRSKGLGYDNVIIINAVNAVYGFPSKINDDPVMKLVVHEDHSIEYAEERRLFYVAMTRTKNRVYIVAPQQRPSRFVAELVNDYPNITVNGTLNFDKLDSSNATAKCCPVCGYPLQYRHKKSFGLQLWICTNEPELCDYMTNDLRGGVLSILKCDKCKDGYLIVKPGKDEPFLGCTNYKPDKTGCNSFMTKEYYLKHIENSKSIKAPESRDL